MLAPAFARGILLIVELARIGQPGFLIVVLACTCQAFLIHQRSKSASNGFDDQTDSVPRGRRLIALLNRFQDRLFHLRSNSIRTHPFLVVEK